MHQANLVQVQKSFARCSKDKVFFTYFYDEFLRCDPRIEQHFEGVSRAKKKVFSHSGITTVLLYAMGSAKSGKRLKDLAGQHGPKGLDVKPELYPHWVDSLLMAVEKYDSEYTPDLGHAWRETVLEGIEIFLKE